MARVCHHQGDPNPGSGPNLHRDHFHTGLIGTDLPDLDRHLHPIGGSAQAGRGPWFGDAGGSTSAGLDAEVFPRLLRDRVVFLGREVDDALANQVCAQLLLLAAEDSERDISIY
ncbi:MAG: ATP-dependent Clp protease proteolytic subunit, partial [Frankia sp.]